MEVHMTKMKVSVCEEMTLTVFVNVLLSIEIAFQVAPYMKPVIQSKKGPR